MVLQTFNCTATELVSFIAENTAVGELPCLQVEGSHACFVVRLADDGCVEWLLTGIRDICAF